MTAAEAVFLGAVQGLTEFLPVSSSGHLVLLQSLLGFSQPPIFFDILVHAGTLLAVVVFFGKELAMGFRRFKGVRQIAIGTFPIVLVGLLVQPFIERIFGSLLLTGLAYFFTAGILWWGRGFGEGEVALGKISDRSAVIVGLFQAIAIFPGVSRSGATIVGGLSQNLSREAAFKFSFLLSVPAILGALILQIKDLAAVSVSAADLWGMLAAFAVGCAALAALRRVLLSGRLYLFSFYCLLLGFLSLVLFVF